MNKNYQIDINCDMGEGIGNDELIMPFINSASIACGYHAGDVTTIFETVELAIKHNVKLGAHPSFADKENFGRTEMQFEKEEVYELVSQQLYILNEIVGSFNKRLHHVKPHGALYNMSARNAELANVIAKAVWDFDEKLILYGLSDSHSIREPEAIGLQTANEVFADRTYQDDGSLTPRTDPQALISEPEKVVRQVLQMINEGTVTTLSGKIIKVKAETICLHSNKIHAVDFAKAIYNAVLIK